MGSFFELVTSTNYKYGLIFKISELQKTALLLITNTYKFENRIVEYICTPRGSTYECEGWATNKKNIVEWVIKQAYWLTKI